MERRKFVGLSTAFMTGALGASSSILPGGGMLLKSELAPGKELNPNTKWLREAKWGLFFHYLVHMPSAPVPEDMTGQKWNKKVNSFQVKKFGEQLTKLKVPYFFITIGQGGGYFCSPNSAYERLFGSSEGKLSERDLVAGTGEGIVFPWNPDVGLSDRKGNPQT